MNTNTAEQNVSTRLSNGAGAAAILSAGLGAFTMAVLAIIGDHSPAFKKLMNFYSPSGPLSGVSTTAIAVWVVCWFGLDAAWKRRDIGGWAIAAGLCLIAIGFVLMFPLIGDLF